MSLDDTEADYLHALKQPGPIFKVRRSYDAGIYESEHIKMVGWEQGMFQSEIALFFGDYLISDHEPIGPPMGHHAGSFEGN